MLDACNFVDISLNQVTNVVSGFNSMLALTLNGEVFGRGSNEYGELGLGDLNTREIWTRLTVFQNEVIQIALGAYHSLFLTADQVLFSCGGNGFGQLVSIFMQYSKQQGIGTTIAQSNIQKVSLTDVCNIAVGKGYSSSYALCTNNSLWSFGNNETGALGLNSTVSKVSNPTRIVYFSELAPIKGVQAGNGFCIVLLEDGSLHAMGKSTCCGQTHVHKFDYFAPIQVRTCNMQVVSLCCSSACTIIKSQNNEWYAFGDASSIAVPGKKITGAVSRIDDAFPKDAKIKKMVASMNAFFLLDDNNVLHVAGNTSYGEMGIGYYCFAPTWRICKHEVVDVQAGAVHSFVFCNK